MQIAQFEFETLYVTALSSSNTMSAISPLPVASAHPERESWRFGKESSAERSDWSIEWILKRNCSMAPQQLFGLFGGLCVLSMSIASFFWAQGAKLVMPFAWLEMVAVGVALLIYARHAADQELIALNRGTLMVQHTSGNSIETVEFVPEWVIVEPVTGGKSLIELSGQGQRVEVGRFVRPELRQQLANELRRAVRVARGWQPCAS